MKRKTPGNDPRPLSVPPQIGNGAKAALKAIAAFIGQPPEAYEATVIALAIRRNNHNKRNKR